VHEKRLEEVFEVSRGVLLLQVVPDDSLEEAQEGVQQDGGVKRVSFCVMTTIETRRRYTYRLSEHRCTVISVALFSLTLDEKSLAF
jgi:hypothetical protein